MNRRSIGSGATRTACFWGASHRLLPLLLVVLIGVLPGGGCVLVAPYDETTDKQITQLEKQVDTLIESIGVSPMPTTADTREAWDAIHADLRLLRVRSEAREANELSTQQLDLLKEQLDLLRAEQERLSPATSPAAPETRPIDPARAAALATQWRAAFDTSFRAILKLELAKKGTIVQGAGSAGE